MTQYDHEEYMYFSNNEVILDDGGEFECVIENIQPNNDLFLIIDIYMLDHNVHPEGHYGWWKYSLDDLQNSVKGKIKWVEDSLRCEINNAVHDDCWVNNKITKCERLRIMAVLRARITNAIVKLISIPGLVNKNELIEYRRIDLNVKDRVNWAVAGYIFPKNTTVRIVAPNIFVRDAVGNLCLKLAMLFQDNSISCKLYAANFDLSLNNRITVQESLMRDFAPNDILLYFFSTYDPLLPIIADLELQKKIVYCHGVTRPNLLQAFDTELSVTCRAAYKQMVLLRNFDVLVFNSKSASNEFKVNVRRTDKSALDKNIKTIVIPPSILSVDFHTHKYLKNDTKFLYVGRVCSHKKVDDLLRFFSEYLNLEQDAKLYIIGNGGNEAYTNYLKWVEEYELKLPADSLYWGGSVSDSDLKMYYKNASAYLSMSEDENFCLPVLEAMLAGLPVFVYGVPAVKELLGGAGIFFMEKDYPAIAKYVYELLNNKKRMLKIIDKQNIRAKTILDKMNGQGFLDLLQP